MPTASPQNPHRPARKERVLIEFPAALLNRADLAARSAAKSRSEFIRNAVENFLVELEARKFEAELAHAYAANATHSQQLADDFAAVDMEGLEALDTPAGPR
jgi:metal-responsive CopG/Arc/MetJ family transcriptional regulator